MHPDNDNFIAREAPGPAPKGGFAVVIVAAVIVVVLIAAALAASKLAASPSRRAVDDPPPTTISEPTLDPQPTTLGSGFESTIAITIVDSLKVFESPDESSAVKVELPRQNEHGVDQVFLVKESRDAWLRVLLPIRPNGTTGWVRIRDLKITGTNYRLRVHVGEKKIELLERGKLVTQFPTAIGKQNTPTPGGEYYLKELLKPKKQNGPYGSYAYGLSGFSNVLESFNGGAGVIGIHGTNDPSSIGKEVSAGCIRMKNEDIEQLVGILPLGTPVEILAD
ncbi:MAG: L,D-transpeptidase [Acidobacteria bacterium]|nr:MAG: L,D-transpeptidase [Acidobacteriota bacterium]